MSGFDDYLPMMRDAIAGLLPSVAVISAGTLVSDGGGGGTLDYVPVAGGTVACRVDPLSSSARSALSVALGRQVTESVYRVTMPHDAPVAANARVTVGANVYQVVALDAVDNDARADRRVIVAAISGG